MNTIRLMRLATTLLVLFLIGHTLGTLTTSSRGPDEDAALAALAAFRFDVMGVTRSHADFYYGLGLCLSVALVLLIWVSLIATRLLADQAPAGRTLSRALATSTALIAIVSWMWIFPAPAILSAIASVCFTWVATRRVTSPPT